MRFFCGARGLVALVIACALLAAAPLADVGEAAASEPVGGDLRWLEKQAAAGDLESWYRIGVIKERGIGMDPDPAGALEAYRTAAEGGHPQAQFRLAQLLAGGFAGPPDFAAARGWYEAAAAQGIAAAAYNVGLMAERGLGGPRDLQAAVQAYRQAAAGGLAAAAVQLALLYLGEDLGEPDRIVGLAWLYKAEALGAAEAGPLAAALAEELTEAQRAEARALSQTL